MTAEPMGAPSGRNDTAGWLIAAFLLLPLAAWLAWGFGERSAMAEIAALGSNRAALYRTLLERELERPGAVPLVLARTPLVAAALGGDGAAARRLDVQMAELVSAAELTDLYVMDAKGRTIAASNASSDHSFVGQDFSFRRYFSEAMAGQIGHEFALGTTSQVPGYYVAQPVIKDGATIGAVVAKVDLARLEMLWADNPERLLLADGDGKVMLTDIPGLRFQPMPVSGEDGSIRLAADGSAERDYLVRAFNLSRGQWRVAILLPISPAKARRAAWGVVGGAGMLAVLLIAFAAAERRRTARAFAQYDRLSRAALEQELKHRTAELVQAAKLATIGQMATGMVHEVNQPLAAIGAFAGNALRFMELGRHDRVGENLTEIAAQVERLATITRRLKGFARRPDEDLAPVALAPAMERVLAMVGPRLREQGVAVEFDPGPHGLAVTAEQIRLEQVMVNLVANALDAMKRLDDGALSIRFRRQNERTLISIADTGPGIPEDMLPRLFDPFTTTKPSGEGLGLGLSIASAIIRDFGGNLSAANRREGGAVFTLDLPNAEHL
ncbi:MAG: sensor histidine kinase, partial [Magnetospirillum sp.]|nr:sensor histidine kinase [Magnetospirillum sp.]